MAVFLIAEKSKLFTSGARTPAKCGGERLNVDASCWLEMRLKALTLNHSPTLRWLAGNTTLAMVSPGFRRASPKPSAWPV